MFHDGSPGKPDPYADPRGDAQSALNLLFSGYVNDARVLSCPPSTLPDGPHISNMHADPLAVRCRPLSRICPRQCGHLICATIPGHTSAESEVIFLVDKKGIGAEFLTITANNVRLNVVAIGVVTSNLRLELLRTRSSLVATAATPTSRCLAATPTSTQGIQNCRQSFRQLFEAIMTWWRRRLGEIMRSPRAEIWHIACFQDFVRFDRQPFRT